METYLLLRRILENIPKQPSGLLADDMKFVDVLQREWRLPYTIFCDYEVVIAPLTNIPLISTRSSKECFNVSSKDFLANPKSEWAIILS